MLIPESRSFESSGIEMEEQPISSGASLCMGALLPWRGCHGASAASGGDPSLCSERYGASGSSPCLRGCLASEAYIRESEFLLREGCFFSLWKKKSWSNG